MQKTITDNRVSRDDEIQKNMVFRGVPTTLGMWRRAFRIQSPEIDLKY